MGGGSSKKPFSEWDLNEFSNVTGEYLIILFIIIYKKNLLDEFRYSSIDGQKDL
jgi:hypothetical protein